MGKPYALELKKEYHVQIEEKYLKTLPKSRTLFNKRNMGFTDLKSRFDLILNEL